MTFTGEDLVVPGSIQQVQESEAAAALPEVAAPIDAANVVVDGSTATLPGIVVQHLAAAEEEATETPAVHEDNNYAAAAGVGGLGDNDEAAQVAAAAAEDSNVGEPVDDAQQEAADAIAEPASADVLSGRGAAINAHEGNKRFRALCFSRKPEFEAGNLAVKGRVAAEIVRVAVNEWGARFLKRTKDKGPLIVCDEAHAIRKATQTMRDFRRPDRVGLFDPLSADGKPKKRRASATPMEDVVIPEAPLEPISENPAGVHDHDVLCGRGAFVNGHVGNKRLRVLAAERKALFDEGNYTEKRGLATEIISIIRNLDPPGRFLQKAKVPAAVDADGQRLSEWEELTDERTIEKTCQVMRDIDREDRQYRIKRREQRDAQRKMRQLMNVAAQQGGDDPSPEAFVAAALESAADDDVDEAVAAAEAIMDKALEDVGAPADNRGPREEPTLDEQTHHHGQSVWV